MEHDMKYLHTMLRISNIEDSLDFYCNMLGLKELRRYDDENGRYTLIFLSTDQDAEHTNPAAIELTYNWDPEDYTEGRNFGHIAYAVDDIYALCEKLMEGGITINRPPRDGRMAFVRSPDNISVELLQVGTTLPIQEPWASMPNTGHW
jgi:lactoylglutathione lyase